MNFLIAWFLLDAGNLMTESSIVLQPSCVCFYVTFHHIAFLRTSIYFSRFDPILPRLTRSSSHRSSEDVIMHKRFHSYLSVMRLTFDSWWNIQCDLRAVKGINYFNVNMLLIEESIIHKTSDFTLDEHVFMVIVVHQKVTRSIMRRFKNIRLWDACSSFHEKYLHIHKRCAGETIKGLWIVLNLHRSVYESNLCNHFVLF